MSTSITRDHIESFVRDEFIAMGVEATAITDEATIEDLGLDSLDIVELSQAAKKKFSLELSPDDFVSVKTFAQAVDAIHTKTV